MSVKHVRVRWPKKLGTKSRMVKVSAKTYDGGQYVVYESQGPRDRLKKRTITAVISFIEKGGVFDVQVTGRVTLARPELLFAGKYPDATVALTGAGIYELQKAIRKARSMARDARDQLRAAA